MILEVSFLRHFSCFFLKLVEIVFAIFGFCPHLVLAVRCECSLLQIGFQLFLRLRGDVTSSLNGVVAFVFVRGKSGIRTHHKLGHAKVLKHLLSQRLHGDLLVGIARIVK